MGLGTSDIFEGVSELSDHEVRALVRAGDTEQAQLALECWRAHDSWERVIELVGCTDLPVPREWEVYLYEFDAVQSGRDPSGHIPLSSSERYRAALDNLQAPARYYFSEFTNPRANSEPKRTQLRANRKQSPRRGILWDVLYASTLKVRNRAQAERAYSLCRPAVKVDWDTVDASEIGNLALLVCLRSALATKDITMIRKTLALLWPQISNAGSDADHAVLVNLRASEVPEFDSTQIDAFGTGLTTVYLSRLYRNLCIGKELDSHIDQLEELLTDRGWEDIPGGATVSIRFTSFREPGPCACSITDDTLCDLIRLQQGALSGIETSQGRRLAALCHAIGGVASAGLGEDEKNADIRHLTEGQETHWAQRGIARRILRTGQQHLLGAALKHLKRGYEMPGLRQNRADPFDLWLYGAEMIQRELGRVLQWVLSLTDETAFNQAMWDVVYPTLKELWERMDEDEVKPVTHTDGRADLLVEVAKSPLLDHRCPEMYDLLESLRALGRPREAIALACICIETVDDPDALIIHLAELAVEAYPPKQALEIIEPYGGRLVDDSARNEFSEHEELLMEVISGGAADPAQHWMLFDPAVPPGERRCFAEHELRSVFHLGAAVTFLASPTGQSLLPYRETNEEFGIWSGDWPRILKSLLSQQLLQIRVDSPKESFTVDGEGQISWIPAYVELAVNLSVPGDAGKSQSGIIVSLPAIVRRCVLETNPVDLLSFWRALVQEEVEAYYFACLSHFRLPTERVGDETEMFTGVAETYSLSDLMNLIYNSCQAAAGEQKAKGLSNPHARNMAKKIVSNRIERARTEGWDIKKGYRSDLMPASYLVRYFCTVFLPLEESVYKSQAPNVESVASALEALKVSG